MHPTRCNCHGNLGLHLWLKTLSLHFLTLILNHWILLHHGSCCILNLTLTYLIHKGGMAYFLIIWPLSLVLQHNSVLQDHPHKPIIYTNHIYVFIKRLGIQHNFLSNPTPTLSIRKKYIMLTMLKCKMFLHFPLVLPYLHCCKKNVHYCSKSIQGSNRL